MDRGAWEGIEAGRKLTLMLTDNPDLARN